MALQIISFHNTEEGSSLVVMIELSFFIYTLEIKLNELNLADNISFAHFKYEPFILVPPRFLRSSMEILIFSLLLIPHHARFGLGLHFGIIEYTSAFLFLSPSAFCLVGFSTLSGLLGTTLIA